jgi:hypothetical protein
MSLVDDLRKAKAGGYTAILVEAQRQLTEAAREGRSSVEFTSAFCGPAFLRRMCDDFRAEGLDTHYVDAHGHYSTRLVVKLP